MASLPVSMSASRSLETSIKWCRRRMRRARKSEVPTKRRGFIFGSENAALLKDRYDSIDERVQCAREISRHNSKAVCRTCVEPRLQLIGNAFWRTPDEAMPLCGARIVAQLP